MATRDPLTLETFTWDLAKQQSSPWEAVEDANRQGSTHMTPGGADNVHRDIPKGDEEALANERSDSGNAMTREEIRLARRTSRKQRPVRTRSLLDEIAAEKGLKNRTPSGDITKGVSNNVNDSDAVCHKNPPQSGSGLSGERRWLMHPKVDELVKAEAEAEGLSVSISKAIPTREGVSSESMGGLKSPDRFSSPMSIPWGSESTSLPSPRPILDVRTKSANPSRAVLARTSARSASSSWSPASAFLSRWGRDESVPAAEPDDEGQEIGQNSGYIIGKQLGYGGFSVVKEAHTFQDHVEVVRAVKIVRKQASAASEQKSEKAQQEFEHEINIWRYIKHPRILPLLAVFDTDFAIFCVMQYSTGGSLFDVVAKHRRRNPGHASSIASPSATSPHSTSDNPYQHRALPLSHAKHYMAQLVSALRYLHHDVRIVHRDIKLENCLLTASTSPEPSSSISPGNPLSDHPDSSMTITNAPGNILLCDFGMADFIRPEERDSLSTSPSSTSSTAPIRTHPEDSSPNPNPRIGPGPNSANLNPLSYSFAGSLPYASPELLQSTTPLYEPSADIWAFGVVCYALLVGELPFRHALEARVAGMIESGAWDVRVLKGAVRAGLVDERDGAGDDDGDGGGRGGRNVEREVEDATELVEGCLRMEVERRWDVRKVLRCRFLEGFGDEEGLQLGENERGGT